MESGQGLVSSSETARLHIAFASLVDATRYAKNHAVLLAKIEETKAKKEKTEKDLDSLSDKFSSDINTMAEALGTEWTEALSRQVVGFSNAAISQIKEKIEIQTRNQIDECLSMAKMEKARAIKGIEAFLSTGPLRLLDKSFSVKLIDGSYSAFSKYSCAGEVNYEFLLDSKSSSLFGKELKLFDYTKSEMKIPFRMVKSWVKKEPVFEYARLDQYILTIADATESTLLTSYSDADGKSSIKIVYSRREGSSPFLTVEHSDGISNTSVTSNPPLANRLDVDSICNTMERIWLGINDLDLHKTALVKLTYREKDILENIDDNEFFDECWNLIAPLISRAIKNQDPGLPQSDRLEEKVVREKLQLLGRQGESILRTIGIPPA